MPQNAFFPRTRDLLVSQKTTQTHFFPTLHPLSTVIFATATVLAFLRERLRSAFTLANQLRWIAEYCPELISDVLHSRSGRGRYPIYEAKLLVRYCGVLAISCISFWCSTIDVWPCLISVLGGKLWICQRAVQRLLVARIGFWRHRPSACSPEQRVNLIISVTVGHRGVPFITMPLHRAVFLHMAKK